jgi:hypothetical protein
VRSATERRNRVDFKQEMEMHTRYDLAQTIMQMNYGELLSVATDLSKMRDAEVRPKIETPEEFANALYDWAESYSNEPRS